MSKLKAGGVPPTELPPLPTDAEIEADSRKFQRGAAKCYAAALALSLAVIAYFLY